MQLVLVVFLKNLEMEKSYRSRRDTEFDPPCIGSKNGTLMFQYFLREACCEIR